MRIDRRIPGINRTNASCSLLKFADLLFQRLHDALRSQQPESQRVGAAQQALFEQLEALRTTLNRALFMGLEDFEAHYALYPPGARYQRHLDSFRGDNQRRVSLVIYLNPDWRRADGGLLRLYTAQGALIDEVLPETGRAVCFLSEEFPHEVTRTRRPRASIACWFRIRPIDPL